MPEKKQRIISEEPKLAKLLAKRPTLIERGIVRERALDMMARNGF